MLKTDADKMSMMWRDFRKAVGEVHPMDPTHQFFQRQNLSATPERQVNNPHKVMLTPKEKSFHIFFCTEPWGRWDSIQSFVTESFFLGRQLLRTWPGRAGPAQWPPGPEFRRLVANTAAGTELGHVCQMFSFLGSFLLGWSNPLKVQNVGKDTKDTKHISIEMASNGIKWHQMASNGLETFEETTR